LPALQPQSWWGGRHNANGCADIELRIETRVGPSALREADNTINR
jgi:hypothetical protein